MIQPPQEMEIKKKKPKEFHSPGKCVVMAGRGQRASFGSFRIAVILRLWATVLNG
jgi:hypothetical protein